MIKIKKYKSREYALEQILILDKDYTLIRHDFKKGEVIEPHKHLVDEWIIFDSGRCEVILGLDSRIVEANNYALAIYIPQNKEHGLKCLSDISYWVLRKTE